MATIAGFFNPQRSELVRAWRWLMFATRIAKERRDVAHRLHGDALLDRLYRRVNEHPYPADAPEVCGERLAAAGPDKWRRRLPD